MLFGAFPNALSNGYPQDMKLRKLYSYPNFRGMLKQVKALVKGVMQAERMVSSSLLQVEAAGLLFQSAPFTCKHTDLTTLEANFPAQKCPNYP